ncbi:MAG: hypothetical protein EON90_10885 [Brevundimonas sp.]|nr:MAG: hypothetical protein EON90_10885 [Brevundimonas sp.]
MSVSNNFLRLGVLAVLVGVSLGIWMGANENFTLRPVHAHINLIGWASMMLFGLVYRVIPEAAKGWMPVAHFILAALGFLIMMPSLSLMLLGNMTLVPFLVASEFMVFASLVLFAIIVFRATGGKPATVAA